MKSTAEKVVPGNRLLRERLFDHGGVMGVEHVQAAWRCQPRAKRGEAAAPGRGS